MMTLENLFLLCRRQGRWRLALGTAAAMLLLLPFGLRKSARTADQATYAARRGPLDITVLEGGSIQALDSQEIKCEVRVGNQGMKILRIVEEGYSVTDEDVRAGKVLVELDSSEIENQLVQQEIQFQSASAAYIDAQENYEIQLNQNVSDTTAAEQKARFARMDFDKYLGTELAASLVAEHGLDKLEPPYAGRTNPPSATWPDAAPRSRETGPIVPSPNPSPGDSGRVAPNGPQGDPVLGDALASNTPVAAMAPPTPFSAQPRRMAVDFLQYAKLEALGAGEAKQRLRKLQDDLQVAQKELTQSQNTLAGTRRLFKEQFVSASDLERDELAHTNVLLKVQTAETARDLYQRYEFLKTAEETLAKYSEAVRELERARKAAVSRLAQAEAKLKAAEAQHRVQLRRRNDLQEQIAKCVIKATQSGLVIYGDPSNEERSSQDRIRAGVTVREYQSIITIPNLVRMSVNVKIHESYINKVRTGQKARITVDAFPDRELEAEVSKVAVLPDSQDRWMNPDLKVYVTSLTINGSHPWLKPGMSAKVEILVDRIEKAVQIPVQSVLSEGGRSICYVDKGLGVEKRPLETGQFNDEFIEIVRGLKEGEKVLLRPPSSAPEAVTPAPPETASATQPGSDTGKPPL